MFERNEFGGKRSGGPENDPMTQTLEASDSEELFGLEWVLSP